MSSNKKRKKKVEEQKIFEVLLFQNVICSLHFDSLQTNKIFFVKTLSIYYGKKDENNTYNLHAINKKLKLY